MMRKLTGLVVLLITTALPGLAQDQDQDQTHEKLMTKEHILLGDVVVIPARQMKMYHFQVIEPLNGASIWGVFQAEGGIRNDIRVMIAEYGDCINLLNGHNANLLYDSGVVTFGRINITIPGAGKYCMAISNGMSLVSPKVVRGRISVVETEYDGDRKYE